MQLQVLKLSLGEATKGHLSVPQVVSAWEMVWNYWIPTCPWGLGGEGVEALVLATGYLLRT